MKRTFDCRTQCVTLFLGVYVGLFLAFFQIWLVAKIALNNKQMVLLTA